MTTTTPDTAKPQTLRTSAQPSAFVRIRLLAFLCFAAAIATHFFWSNLSHEPRQLLHDPATLLLPASLVGLALRQFWARYFTICFGVGVLVVHTIWWRGHWIPVAFPLLAILLLTGAQMRDYFEGRPARFNRWMNRIPEIERLKLVLVAQSVAGSSLYAVHDSLHQPLWVAATLTALVGCVGLGMQKTWALVVLLAAVVLEAYLAFQLIDVRPTGPAGIAALIAAMGVAATLVLLGGFARSVLRGSRGEANI